MPTTDSATNTIGGDPEAISTSDSAVTANANASGPERDSNEGAAALWGWSPQDLPADTALKRRVDRLVPRRGLPAVIYFAAVVALLNIAPHLRVRAGLATLGLAALAGGAWCAANFWRCRHAHCVVTSTGWFLLAALAFLGAALGHSVIDGAEQPVFVAVLIAALVFECGWYRARGTNAVAGGRTTC